MIEKLYLDKDGVLADFHGVLTSRNIGLGVTYYFKPEETWTAEQHEEQRVIRAVMDEPGFWLTLPKCPGAEALWGFADQLDHTVLTALPRVCADPARIEREKRLWIPQTFGYIPSERIIVCQRHEKAALAHGPGHVLVDDMPVNCDEWRAAGGTAILHRDAFDTIHQLKGLL